MKNVLLQLAMKLNKEHRFRKRWQKVASVLAAIAVFCTTYALILPAITMEQEPKCGMEAHEHDESCCAIQTVSRYSCGLDESEGHAHGDDCYETALRQTCGQIEGHSHDEACFEEQSVTTCAVEESEGHTHSDGCYTSQTVTVCALEENGDHTHEGGCYVAEDIRICGLEENGGHTHEGSCYAAESVLTCGLEESAGHSHTEDCAEMQTVQICGSEENHVHGDSCYIEATALICTLEETQGHLHDESCMVVEEVSELVCGLEEHIHEDACYPVENQPVESKYLCASGEHSHSDACSENCSIPEHTHSAACLVEDFDPNADLETAADWEATLETVELTGEWAVDVLAIAESQLGYTESTRNVILTDSGDLKGYTRYGDWYGVPYGDWCAMFVSFCLDYAGVEDFPLDSNCVSWIEKLEELEIYFTPDVYTPVPGDVIFFDWNDNGSSDHVGLVTEVMEATEDTPAQIKTIEGNSNDRVQYRTYDMDDMTILGCGKLPEAPYIYHYSDDTVQVQVVLPRDTTVPEDAVLTCTPIVEEDESYADLLTRAEESVEGSITNVMFYDLSFYTQDQIYLPVEDTAKVTMKFAESPVSTESNVTVLHFHESEASAIDVEEPAQATEVSVLEDVTVEEQTNLPETDTANTVISFSTDGFSVYALVETENGLADDVIYTEVVTDVTALNGLSLIISHPGTGAVMTTTASNNNSRFAATEAADVLRSGSNTYTYVKLPSTLDLSTVTWKFTKITSNVGNSQNVYRISCSINNSTYYLAIGTNNSINLNSNSNNSTRIQVVTSGYSNTVCLKRYGGNQYIDLYNGNISDGFGGWEHSNTTDGNICMVLSQKIELTNDDKTLVTNLAGTSGAILGVSNWSSNTDRYPAISTTTPATATAINATISSDDWNVTTDDDISSLIWTFEAADALGSYYIKCGSNYLNVSANGLRVSTTPQAIEAVSADLSSIGDMNAAADNVFCLRASVNGTYYYVTQTNSGFNTAAKKTDAAYLVLVNNEIQVVPNSTTLNATVKLFNYDSSVNDVGLGLAGYKFFNGDTPAVDGTASSGTYSTTAYVSKTLSVKGYPQLLNASGAVLGDMEYLFSDSNNNWYINTMTDGGGLFQQDEEGYYYYFSDKNAAYFDEELGRFVLYDTVVRPCHKSTSAASSDEMSNFLPFNNPVGNTVMDESNQKKTGYLTSPTDLWFGMSVEFDFFMPKDGQVKGEDMIFQFHGDDDVFVYIDGVLILDIGGTHAAMDGFINFATGAVQYTNPSGTTTTTIRKLYEAANVSESFDEETYADYTIHTLNFYYLERGGNISYCGMKFNMPALPVNSLTVTKQMLDGTTEDPDEEFTFRVVEVNDGTTGGLFVKSGDNYQILKDGVDTGETREVGENGLFKLKAGESALFSNILGNTTTDAPKIIVQELLSSDQEYNVYYSFSSDRILVSVENEDSTVAGYSVYDSKAYDSADNSEMITFYNAPTRSGTLSVTKTMATGFTSNEKFDIQIKLDDSLLPVGTRYHVYGAEGETKGTVEEVKTEGIISLYPGETINIIGILPGTQYEVTEVLRDGQLYKASYGVQTPSSTARPVEGETPIESTGTVTATGVTGTIGINSVVTITATNKPVVGVQVPISKKVVDSTASDTFTFHVEQVGSDYVTPVSPANSSDVTITVTEEAGTANASGSALALLSIDDPTAGSSYYFKISEVANSGAGVYTYDTGYYIVQVTANSDSTASVTRILKNGTDSANSLAFVNTVPIGYELPATGGMGTTSLYTLGLLLVGAAAIMYIIGRKRKKGGA